MSEMFIKFLSVINWRQEWHICWVAKLNKGRTATADGTYTIKPVMRSESIKDLRERLAEDTGCRAEDINITSMIKLSG